MAPPQRGDIFWAGVPEKHTVGSEQYSDKPRPWLVVSIDQINANLPVVIGVPLTSQVGKANRKFRILIPESQKIPEPGTTGCPGDSLALTEQIRILSRDRLVGTRIARVTPVALSAVETGIAYVLGLP